MSNVVKRFQNVQSKYAKFNPAKAAVLSAAATGNNGSPEGSISEAGSRTPTSALGVDFQAAILAQNIEVNEAAEPEGTKSGPPQLVPGPVPGPSGQGSVSLRKNSNLGPPRRSVGGPAGKRNSTVGKSPVQPRRGGTVAIPSNRVEVQKLATNFLTLNKRRRAAAASRSKNKPCWQDIVRINFLQKGKIPLLLAVEAGNQSMCRELLSAQTADQLKVSKTQPFISQKMTTP